MPHPDDYDWAKPINMLERGKLYRNAWLHHIQYAWWDDSQTPQTLILDMETNSYYISNELDQEIDAFFRSHSNKRLRRMFDEAEASLSSDEASLSSTESSVRTDEMNIPVHWESPLDPHIDNFYFFLTLPSFSMLLALGLFLFLVLIFLALRKVWKNRTKAA